MSYEDDEEAMIKAAIEASLKEYQQQQSALQATSKQNQDDVYDDIDDDDGMDYSDGDEDDAGDGEDMEENDPDESDIVHDDHITLDDDSTLKEEQYECLDRKDIVERQTRVISKVADVLSVPFSTARLLLQAMQWDSDKLYSAWNDREKICASLGVNPDENATATVGPGECPICYESTNNIWTLSCGHGYCEGCWKEFLRLQIQEKKQRIKCPGIKCPRFIDEYTVMQLAGDDRVVERFNEVLIESYVDIKNMIRWCPAPGCTHAIQLKQISAEQNESVLCKCGNYFCFRCTGEGHAPATCEMYEDWKKKVSGTDESLNQKAIAILSRPCPNCKKPIEKNGGCAHMTCSSCQYHFCWHCMGKFGSGPLGGSDGYSTHKCNKYYKEDDKIALDKDDWNRYKWYADRYESHQRSREIEKELLKEAETVRTIISNATCLAWSATAFYKDALQQLVTNRTVLMYSYVFGFYRPLKRPDINKNLFEHRQNELERHTEMLARIFDHDMDVEEEAQYFVERRLEIINLTKLAQVSNRSLIDVASNAFEPSYNDRQSLRSSAGAPWQSTAPPPAAPKERGTNPQQQQRRGNTRDVANQEERDLEEAMRLSLLSAAQTDDYLLQKALEESLFEPINESVSANEEDELQKAILLSLSETKRRKAK